MYVYKLYKSSLAKYTQTKIDISGETFAVSNWLDSNSASVDSYVDTSLEIPFVINASPSQIPFLDDSETVIVIREKINISEQGQNAKTATSAMPNEGSTNYKNKTPYNPVNMPVGFKELRHG